MTVVLRQANRAEHSDAVWRVIEPAVVAGETFCADPTGGKSAGLAYFWPETADVWLAESADGQALGCCYLRPNQSGNGAHVCNAGYCTHPTASGRGVARLMLDHTLAEAEARGYLAMQFNFVVSTNTRAIATWERAGFDIVGRLPGAFRHPIEGYVDALVLHKTFSPS